MSFTLVLNSNNVIGNNNNIYEYEFINGGFNINDDNWEIAVGQITIPYSFYNITTRYANNILKFKFPIGGSLVQYTITIPDGFYSVSDLNQYIQYFCIQNGLYLINSTGFYVYYLSMQYNISQYSVQLLTYVVPTSLPSGYTQPSNWVGFPVVAQTPQYNITPQITNFLGFTVGNYPPNTPQTTNYNVNSNTLVIGSTVNNIVVRCDLVRNPVISPSDIIDTFPINANFGSNINYQPSFEKWGKINRGIYNKFSIRFVDQNGNDIVMLDNNVCISLLIRQRK